MGIDKLVDSSKLDACCTAEADAIREKTGSNLLIDYDFENNKGFAQAIHDIPTGSGGLPDPSDLADGTAMVAVDGEWTMQEGYGYDTTAFSPIIWDGDTENRAHFTEYQTSTQSEIYYKVSDRIFTSEELFGSTLTLFSPPFIGEEDFLIDTDFLDQCDIFDNAFFACNYAFVSGQAGTYYVESRHMDLTIPEDGTYFGLHTVGQDATRWVLALAAPLSVQTIDPKFIPQIGSVWDDIFEKPFEGIGSGLTVNEDGELEADVTVDDTTGLIPLARINHIRTNMDSVAVARTQYYLGEQTAVNITMPGNAEIGQEIVVCFKSGSTAATLTCDLDGFDFVPKANKTNKIVFTLVHKADEEVPDDEDDWLVEVKEG